MEITTIVGIVVAIIIIGVGLKMVLRKGNHAVPSLDSELHIHADSQQPVIPRHVRDQLQEPSAPVVQDVAPAATVASTPEVVATPVVDELKTEVPEAAVEKVVAIPVEDEAKDKEKPAEFSLNNSIEKAEIAEFAEHIKNVIVEVEPWTKDYFEME